MAPYCFSCQLHCLSSTALPSLQRQHWHQQPPSEHLLLPWPAMPKGLCQHVLPAPSHASAASCALCRACSAVESWLLYAIEQLPSLDHSKIISRLLQSACCFLQPGLNIEQAEGSCEWCRGYLLVLSIFGGLCALLLCMSVQGLSCAPENSFTFRCVAPSHMS